MTTNTNHTQLIDSPHGKGLATKTACKAGDLLIRIPSPFLALVENYSLQSTCSSCLLEDSPLQPNELTKCPSCEVLSYCSAACRTADWDAVHRHECAVYRDKLQDTQCRECGVASAALKKCVGCKVVSYCSKSCQEKAWKGGHKKECRALKGSELTRRVIPTVVRGAMRILYGEERAWMELVDHRKEMAKSDAEKLQNLALQARAAVEFAGTGMESMVVAMDALCRMESNAFRITNMGDIPIGLCFDPLLARINHSCLPNVAVTFDGKIASVRALHDLQAGDEILTSYIDNTRRREVRQELLRQTYFFTCHCPPCADDKSPYELFLAHLVAVPDAHDVLGQKDLEDTAVARVRDERDPTGGPSKEYALIRKLQQAFPAAAFEQMNEQSKRSSSDKERLDFLITRLKSVQLMLARDRYAQYPIPLIFNELYEHSLSTNRHAHALILLLFTTFHITPYIHPSPYTPSLTQHLFALAALHKHIHTTLTSSPPPSPPPALPALAEAAIRTLDHLTASHVLLACIDALMPRVFGEGTRQADVLARELRDVEAEQRERGRADVVRKLDAWRTGVDEGEGEGRKIVREFMGRIKGVGELALAVFLN